MAGNRVHIHIRLQVLSFLMLLCLGGLAARLWWVQVACGAEYTARIRNSSQVTVRIPSVRGEIRDRNGVTLVTNRASYEVDFYLPAMVKGFRERFGEVPLHEYRTTVAGMAEDRKEADIVEIVNQGVIPRLEQLDLAKEYNAKRLRTHFRNDREVPFTYLEDLDFNTLARFAENDAGLPGVDITLKPVRRYVFGSMAAHLLGYVGAMQEIDREESKNFDFYQADVEGKAQVELYMDKWLRGSPGVRVMRRNAKGAIEGQLRYDPPQQGANVLLTIDARIQAIAENAIRNVGRGAVVVVDPNNGDILAMVSVPSYDPNTFIPSISAADWAALRADETDPLTNRAISGYAPGSTYKIPIALAGLRKGLTSRTSFTCSGGVTYGTHYMKCWIAEKKGAHGSLTLSQAIKVSCNAFFYQYGNAAGIENIVATGNDLGLGQRSGIEVSGESPGILPGPQWLAEHNPRERWSSGHTANVSIGQGYVLATPLQMAMVAATVANGGVSYYPRLIDRVVSQSGEVLLQDTPRVRANLVQSGISAENIELVRRGMWKVVNEGGGTAGRARLKDIEVAGKTGTAQFWRGKKKDNHTWFLSFAPYENPKYAICVFVQGAKAGGLVSAPIAAKIYEEIFKLTDAPDYQLAALEPAKGNFRFVQEINFGREIPAAIGTDEETGGTVTNIGGTAQEQTAGSSAAPNIKPEADEEGSLRSRSKKGRTGPAKPNFFQRLFKKKPTPGEKSAPRPGR